MLIIGLAGGMGSGKSTVARLLGELGATVLDTDALIRQAYGPGGELSCAVAEMFGPDMLSPDGSADRAKIAALVFADPDALARLNGLVHPWVRDRWRALLAEAAQAGAQVGVVEGALYVDKTPGFDQLWVTYLDRASALERALARGGLTRQQAEARLAAQLAPEDHAKQADVVVDTSGTPEEVEERVRGLWQQHVARRLEEPGVRSRQSGEPAPD